MNELTAPKLARPMDKANLNNDTAMLNALVGDMNNLAGVRAPREASSAVVVPVSIPAAEAQIPAATIAPVVELPSTPVPAAVGKKVFLTGSLAVGKDYVAAQIGAPIFGFADPLYAIAQYLTGVEVTSTHNKDLPGMRKLLQQVGQWGRNDVDDTYPYTAARVSFCLMIRSLGTAGVIDPDNKWKIDWKNFGLDPMLWTDALLQRVGEYLAATPGGRVTNTNVRFKHEYEALTNGGWTHYHVMCSPATWAKRLATKKLTPDSPLLKDKSEQMAAALNANVTKVISREPRGKMLRCIWNDTVPSPSPRILSLAQFCEQVAQSDGVVAAEINTGE